jgi:hypothetical protein
VKANSPNGIDKGTAKNSLGHGKATQPLALCLQTYFLNNVRRAWPWKIHTLPNVLLLYKDPLNCSKFPNLSKVHGQNLCFPSKQHKGNSLRAPDRLRYFSSAQAHTTVELYKECMNRRTDVKVPSKIRVAMEH